MLTPWKNFAAWNNMTALTTSPLFRENHLPLLCNVPINNNQFVEYLVCTDKAQLMGISVENPLDGPLHIMLGEVDTLLSSLETILNDPKKPAALPSRILEIPESPYEKMAMLHLT